MANEYLQRTPTSTGNRKVFTWSGWFKRAFEPSTIATFFQTMGNSSDGTYLHFENDGIRYRDAINNNTYRKTTAVYRDYSSWSHILLNVDTTHKSENDRIKLYVNGIQLTDFSTTNNPALNADLDMNIVNKHLIGAYQTSSLVHTFEGELADIFMIDGQALTPDVFGFYKDGNGYISAGSTQATDFRPGQWVPKTPRVIKAQIERNGGFGVNGFYLPMNDSSNFGADFHTTPNSIITLKGEDLPQPRNGAPETTDAYVSQLRTDPYAANLVLAVPGISGGTSSGYGDYSADIKGSGSNKTLTANGNAGVAVTASYYGSALSFDGSGDYLRTSTNISDFQFGTGDFTIETWLWKPANGVNNYDSIITLGTSGNSIDGWFLEASSTRGYVFHCNTTQIIGVNTSPNTSQWNHLAVCRKGNNTTMYLNGAAIGIGTTTTPYSVPTSATTIDIGAYSVGDGNYWFNGYLQDLRVYKGVAKYKGGFDVPKPYTPVGIGTWRAVPDCTANNFATWNPISPASDTTFTNGNLTVAYGSNASRGSVTATIGIAVTGAGKYYWENRVDASSTSPTNAMIGVWGMSTSTSAASYPGFTNTYGWSYYGNSGGTDGFYWATGGATNSKSYGATYTTGDIIGVTLDMTTNNGSLEFYKNGVSQGVATTGIGTFLTDGKIHAIMPAIGDGASAATYTASINFGQNPTFSGNVAAAGTFTDSNGKGLFKYQPPSGFLALCEDNLPTPAIADPGEYFKTVLYTGDGSSGRSIVGVGFTPDLVWIKRRNGASDHVLQDSVRGFGSATKLSSSSTKAESVVDNGVTDPKWGYLNSAGSDGFSLNASTNGDQVNKSTADPYVAWCWRAGAGTTSTNTDGSIQSVISVNQDAGFSIVSYTGDGNSGATVGHGLGKRPKMIISKSRTAAVQNWYVWLDSISQTTANVGLSLNSTSAAAEFSYGNFTSLNTSTVTLTQGGSGILNVNTSGGNYITYCWAEIEGFSKAFSYTGNGNADGPMIWLGLKPAFVILKRTDNTGNWVMHDNARNSTNPAKGYLVANGSGVEEAGNDILDFLSNGFKIRSSWTDINASGGTYIGMAFAESPFAYSNSK